MKAPVDHAAHLDDSEKLAACLARAFRWLEHCYAAGDRDFKAKHPEEAARRDAALSQGVGRRMAHVDLDGCTVHFTLALDDGPEGAIEIPLFDQGFDPTTPSH